MCVSCDWSLVSWLVLTSASITAQTMQAGCYNHCVRLARAHELDGEAMVYALKGP